MCQSSMGHQGSWLLERRQACILIGLVAVLAYANTLLAGFTFDDNFAVVSNGDVTNAGIPLRDLLKHDFWGQDITSTQSHKSYRPLTILVFRLTHRAWSLLTAAAPFLTQLLPAVQHSQDEAAAPVPDGPHPFPFHVLCVAMHAVASTLVLGLCQHLFAVLEDSYRPATMQPDGEPAKPQHSSAAASNDQVRGQGRWQQLVMWQQQPRLWRLPSSRKYRAQALIAGLMFALHPIHTEAVAGVVGCAELICVALSVPALLCYFMAVDGRYAAAQQLQEGQAAGASTAASQGSRRQAGKQHSACQSDKQPKVAAPATAASLVPPVSLCAADAMQHWLLVLAAAALAFCAALSKEIGITVTGTMLLYDVLLAPHLRLPSSSSSSAGWKARQAACRRQLLRMVLVAATAVVYVKMRQWVAVQQLVQIYRKVENPIPFASSRTTRALSTGYLHVRYAWLLFVPLHLSADWSFSCIPLVEGWGDVRNLATLVLYSYLFYAALAAGPIELMGQLWQVASAAAGARPRRFRGALGKAANGTAAAQPAPGEPCMLPAGASSAAGCVRTRWRLLVLVGLVVAPFFPASNVLFYVGTFIGERLLYSPSIGFCLLVAELLGAALPDAWHQQGGPVQQHEQEGEPQAPAQAADLAKQRGADSPVVKGSTPPQRSWGVVLVCALLLAGYAARTLLRNQDWLDDERLFLSALRVCPDSAKVQQNNGVLQRRLKNYTAAMQHFKRAQEIEPGYCEPTYWIGLTTFNMGDPRAGIATMKASLPCRYTASEALQALNKVYLLMVEAAKGSDVGPMLEWATVLASPHVLRLADACSTAEDAALGAALLGKGVTYVDTAVSVCRAGIHEWEHGEVKADTMAALSRERLADTNATLLAECVDMRHTVYRELAIHDVASKPVRQAVYKYMATVAEGYAACRTAKGGGPTPLGSEGSQPGPLPSSHQKLIHKVQAADPEDPWLQYEWGTTLLALGPALTLKDAAMHMEVAAAVFAKVSQEIATAQQQGVSIPKGSQLTELDGRTPLTALSALQAAMRPLAAFLEAADAASAAEQGLVEQACDVMQRLCHLKLQVVLVRQQQQAADQQGLQDAMKAARQCLADIEQRPSCAAQAEKLRKMVRVKK